MTFYLSWFFINKVLILLLLEPQFSQGSNSTIDNAIFKFCRIDIKKLQIEDKNPLKFSVCFLLRIRSSSISPPNYEVLRLI